LTTKHKKIPEKKISKFGFGIAINSRLVEEHFYAEVTDRILKF